MSEVFCDKINLSFPPQLREEVTDNLPPVFDIAGAFLDVVGAKSWLYRFKDGGTCRIAEQYRVLTVQLSGQALTQMRGMDLLGEYLRAASEFPHRVTLIHATLDIATYAPPILDRLYEKANKGLLQLSRKRIPSDQVNRVQAMNLKGDNTGTVYFGKKSNEVYGKAYDKEQERLDNAGESIGPMLRIELGITGQTGISLKDCYNPAPVFYKYASPGLVERPEGVPDFVPGGEGFELPKRLQLLPAQRMARRVDSSPDLTAILKLAEQVGPHGLDYLWRLIEKRYKGVTEPSMNVAIAPPA